MKEKDIEMIDGKWKGEKKDLSSLIIKALEEIKENEHKRGVVLYNSQEESFSLELGGDNYKLNLLWNNFDYIITILGPVQYLKSIKNNIKNYIKQKKQENKGGIFTERTLYVVK